MRLLSLSAIAWWLLVVLGGCHRHPEATPKPKTESAPPTSEAWVMPVVASRAAFELTLAARGALLVWSPPAARGAGIVARALDASGTPTGDDRNLAKTQPGHEVVELAAAFATTGVGVAWIESSANAAAVRALRLDSDARGTTEPMQLASTNGASPLGRGRLALAGDDGRLRVLYPTGPSECIESNLGPCTGFGFRELGATPPPRQEPWLSVPQPCTTGAVALGGLPGHWFYALCSWTGEAPATTAYAIQMEPMYARADQVLKGCTPIGMTRVDAQTLLLVGDCGPVRRAARLGLSPTPPAELVLEEPRVQCTPEGAAVLGNGWALPLDGPRDRLETVLPAALAPEGSRVVFTGQALLVAEPTATGIALHIHTCADGSVRTR
jgi:hypothetical protein